MPAKQETHLERKLRQLGLSAEGACPTKKCTFKVFFPKPPYYGVEYHAAKTKEGFNFVGLLLGHGGSTLQRIQKETGTKIEIQDRTGNLNGAHPAANDPTLHALVTADSKDKLTNAVQMIVAVLEPLNTSFEPLKIDINSSAILKPVMADHLWFNPSQEEDDDHTTGHTSPVSMEENHTAPFKSLCVTRDPLLYIQSKTQPYACYNTQQPGHQGNTTPVNGMEGDQHGWPYHAPAIYAATYIPGSKPNDRMCLRDSSFSDEHTEFQKSSFKTVKTPIKSVPLWLPQSGPSLPWGSDVTTIGRPSWEYQPTHATTQADVRGDSGLYGFQSPVSSVHSESAYIPLNPLEDLKYRNGNLIPSQEQTNPSAAYPMQTSLYSYGSSVSEDASRLDLQEPSDASIDHLVGLLVP